MRFCLLIGAIALGVARLPAAETAPPNVVVILCDDLGYGDVRALNPRRGKIATPAFDRLAREGMTFTDAHSGSSVCTPTRYGLLTGRYAWRTRLQKGVLDNYDEPLIAAGRLTLPGMLQRHGYHTACIGKWHLGFTIDTVGEPGKRAGKKAGAPLGAVTRDGPTTRGFDAYFGFHHARMMESVFENDRCTLRVEPVDMLPLLAKRAAEYVTQRAATGKPFFLYLPLNSPHTPIVPSAAWKGKSGLGDYADFVMETDWACDEVLAALDRAGIAENTLVLFSSDNGCSPAAKTADLEQQGHYPSAEFRGYKSDIWDGGHRVPFVVRWPARVQAGSTSDRLTCLTDVIATCAELVDAQLPPNACEDGVSFFAALAGDAQPAASTAAAHDRAVVHHSINGKFAIRRGKWKLCLCAGSGGWSKEPTESPQLYDLDADVAERNNVAEQHPTVVAELTQLLEKYIAAGRSTPGPQQPNDGKVAFEKQGTAS